MDKMKILKPADLIFTHSDTALGWAIRFFERHLGEEKTYTNHVAIFGPHAETVIEALWHVKQTYWRDWVNQNEHFEVWRLMSIGDGIRDAIASEASKYIGRDYGWWKLGLHAMDGAISKIIPCDIFLFRRLMFVDKYPICSWVGSYSYKKLDIDFGCPPNVADPDRMRDWVVKPNSTWKMIYKKPEPVIA